MSQSGALVFSGGGGGTVTSFSFNDDNGFAGTVTNPTTTPELTLETTVDDYETIYALNGALTGAGPGTAGQVYTSNGPSVAPTFEDAAAGGFSPAKIVVSPTAGEGDYTTIAAAIAAAADRDIIYIKEGTYTETFTVNKKLSFVALTSGSGIAVAYTENPVILNCVITCNTAWVLFSGIHFNAAALTAVNNTRADGVITFRDCSINQTRATNGVFLSTSAPSDNAQASFYDCLMWSIGTTAPTLCNDIRILTMINCTVPQPDALNQFLYQDQIIACPADDFCQVMIQNCQLQCTVRNPNASGYVTVRNSTVYAQSNPVFEGISTQIRCYDSIINTNGDGAFEGGGLGNLTNCSSFNLLANNGSSVILAGCVVTNTFVPGPGSLISSSTVVAQDFSRGGAPASIGPGTINYIVSASLAQGSAIPLTNATDTTILTVNIPLACEAEISGLVMIRGTLTGTDATAGISVTTDDLSGTQLGLSANQTGVMPLATADQGIVIPPFKVTTFGATDYYLVVNVGFTVGTATAYGSLQAKIL